MNHCFMRLRLGSVRLPMWTKFESLLQEVSDEDKQD